MPPYVFLFCVPFFENGGVGDTIFPKAILRNVELEVQLTRRL